MAKPPKVPAPYKGLRQPEEIIQTAVEREKDIKKKGGMQLASLVESHKAQKTYVAATSVGVGVVLDGLAHANETIAKWDPVISGAVGLGGLLGGAFAEEEEFASLGLGCASAGFTRMLAAGVRFGIDKYRESRDAA